MIQISAGPSVHVEGPSSNGAKVGRLRAWLHTCKRKAQKHALLQARQRAFHQFTDRVGSLQGARTIKDTIMGVEANLFSDDYHVSGRVRGDIAQGVADGRHGTRQRALHKHRRQGDKNFIMTMVLKRKPVRVIDLGNAMSRASLPLTGSLANVML